MHVVLCRIKESKYYVKYVILEMYDFHDFQWISVKKYDFQGKMLILRTPKKDLCTKMVHIFIDIYLTFLQLFLDGQKI